MEPLGRKATKSGGRGTRPQASGCVSLQVDCGLLGPQRGPWAVPTRGWAQASHGQGGSARRAS